MLSYLKSNVILSYLTHYSNITPLLFTPSLSLSLSLSFSLSCCPSSFLSERCEEKREREFDHFADAGEKSGSIFELELSTWRFSEERFKAHTCLLDLLCQTVTEIHWITESLNDMSLFLWAFLKYLLTFVKQRKRGTTRCVSSTYTTACLRRGIGRQVKW